MTNQPTTNEPVLAPCPFCGQPAKFEDGGFNAIRVACSDFDCEQRRRVHKRDKNCHAKLASHWNTRISPASTAPAVDNQWFELALRYLRGDPTLTDLPFAEGTVFADFLLFWDAQTPHFRSVIKSVFQAAPQFTAAATAAPVGQSDRRSSEKENGQPPQT